MDRLVSDLKNRQGNFVQLSWCFFKNPLFVFLDYRGNFSINIQLTRQIFVFFCINIQFFL